MELNEEKRIKHKEYMKQYNLLNKEKLKEWRKNRTEEQKEKAKLFSKMYYYKMKGNELKYNEYKIKHNEASIRYRQKHKEKIQVSNYIKYNDLKEIVYQHYGNKCACCGESIKSFLQIDHINNDGSIQRKKLGRGEVWYKWIIRNNFPNDLQILCANCNQSKRMNNGVCEHVTMLSRLKQGQPSPL